MRVLFLDQFPEPGGAQRCLLDILPALRPAGWEAHVALPGNGRLTPMLHARGATVHPLSLSDYSLGRKTLRDAVRFLRDLGRVAREIRVLAERLRPAVLYVNGPRLMPAVARSGVRLPVVFHSHSCIPARNGRALVARALERTNARVVAATRCAARQWSRPAAVIYGGAEGPPPAWVRVVADGHRRVGLIGRFAPGKCQREFVRAAAELEWEKPGIDFLLAGDALFSDPDGRQYKREVLAEAPASVRYLGWVENTYEVLGQLDLLVVPTTSEGGIPCVILEAFSAGVPVLASPAGDTGEVIRDSENGFLLPSTAPAGIAQRIREILSEPTRMEAAARAARCLWRERFTADRYRAEILDVLESTAARDS
jgi:glycosyltransferase involved in cell wall biosynthesis